MSKTIVCSVGTSAAKGICPPRDLRQWVSEHGGPERAAEEMYQRFQDVEPEGDALRDQLSAEIHSLVRIGLEDCARVILLASATDDGHACALAVKKYLRARWPSLQIEATAVGGLQVTDSIDFRRQGVVEYCKRCLDAVRSYGPENVILNPTGGFKALVPYTVLVGMIKRVPCHYIFEQSSVLLQLPPLPVEFQRRLFGTYADVFQRIEQETSIPKAEWENAVPFEDRDSLRALFEFQGSDVTLSGLGLLFLDEVRKPVARVPFLSRRAWKDCLDNLALRKDCDPFRYLDRVAQSDKALQQGEHGNAKHGMRWLKPGRTTDRYLVSVEDWRLLVWRAVREDEVGPNYRDEVRVDPVQERARYAPFTRMELHR